MSRGHRCQGGIHSPTLAHRLRTTTLTRGAILDGNKIESAKIVASEKEKGISATVIFLTRKAALLIPLNGLSILCTICELRGFVTGHDFSRAEKQQNERGL